MANFLKVTLSDVYHVNILVFKKLGYKNFIKKDIGVNYSSVFFIAQN